MHILKIILLLVSIALLSGCGGGIIPNYEPFTQAQTSNNRALSVRNSQSVGNSIASLVCGPGLKPLLTDAHVQKFAAASTDTNQNVGELSREERMSRNRNPNFNNRWNRPWGRSNLNYSRPQSDFEDKSTGFASAQCIPETVETVPESAES